MVKAQSLNLPGFKCHLLRLKSTAIIWAKKLTSAMNPLFLIPANFRIFQREMQVYIPVMVPPSGEVTTVEGVSSVLLNYLPIKLGRCFNPFFDSLLQEWLPVVRL